MVDEKKTPEWSAYIEEAQKREERVTKALGGAGLSKEWRMALRELQRLCDRLGAEMYVGQTLTHEETPLLVNIEVALPGAKEYFALMDMKGSSDARH